MKQGLGLLICAISSWLVGQQPSLSVSPKILQAHVEFLSDDLLEGRGTGERGGELTVRYLETQSKLLGLQPFNGTSYRQSVKIAGSKHSPPALFRLLDRLRGVHNLERTSCTAPEPQKR